MIHLFRDYYLSANGSSYICGKAASSRAERLLRGSERYYTTLASAVASTAEIALRDAIAAGEVQTLQEAVQELRCIRDEIMAAVSGKEVEQNG